MKFNPLRTQDTKEKIGKNVFVIARTIVTKQTNEI